MEGVCLCLASSKTSKRRGLCGCCLPRHSRGDNHSRGISGTGRSRLGPLVRADKPWLRGWPLHSTDIKTVNMLNRALTAAVPPHGEMNGKVESDRFRYEIDV